MDTALLDFPGRSQTAKNSPGSYKGPAGHTQSGSQSGPPSILGVTEEHFQAQAASRRQLLGEGISATMQKCGLNISGPDGASPPPTHVAVA